MPKIIPNQNRRTVWVGHSTQGGYSHHNRRPSRLRPCVQGPGALRRPIPKCRKESTPRDHHHVQTLTRSRFGHRRLDSQASPPPRSPHLPKKTSTDMCNVWRNHQWPNRTTNVRIRHDVAPSTLAVTTQDKPTKWVRTAPNPRGPNVDVLHIEVAQGISNTDLEWRNAHHPTRHKRMPLAQILQPEQA
jgi:hypothetical protein